MNMSCVQAVVAKLQILVIGGFGCFLCTYWICLDCAYKSLPGAEPQNKGSTKAKKFYDSYFKIHCSSGKKNNEEQ